MASHYGVRLSPPLTSCLLFVACAAGCAVASAANKAPSAATGMENATSNVPSAAAYAVPSSVTSAASISQSPEAGGAPTAASAPPDGGSELAQEAELHGDIEVGVVLDATEQSGQAVARVRIHATREVVWSLITSCREALTLVPGLIGCEVVDAAPDGSWQTIRHVLDYSWFVPKLTYVVHATYEKPARVSIERISGDLKTLRVSWTLQADGEDTIAGYAIDLAPGFWVPHWVVRMALRRDLPKMLRALRTRAEARQR